MLCVDYPAEILNGLLKMIDKKEEENVEFDEFLNSIKTIMLYDTYFEEMQVLFKYLDVKGTSKIVKNHLVEAIQKLRLN
jgi:Ca2+-binding EF-hand superfamily protein